MLNDLDQRSGKVMDFINGIEKNRSYQSDMNSIANDPTVKLRKLATEREVGVNVCLDTIFAKLYKNALPLDDDYKCSHDSELDNEVHSFILNRSENQGPKYYVREALRKNNSPKLKRILEAAEKISGSYCDDKADKISDISIADLDYKMTSDQLSAIDRVVNDLEFDDIAKVISDNVKQTALDEIQRAKTERATQEQLEQELAQNNDVATEAAVQRELALRNIHQPRVYQPSLFEAIMMAKTKTVTESGFGSNDEAFGEAVKEYTLLSMSKALMLESFDLDKVRKMAHTYLK